MFPGGRKPLQEYNPRELWELFITDEMLQLVVKSTNKRVENLELMKTCMTQPVLQVVTRRDDRDGDRDLVLIGAL